MFFLFSRISWQFVFVIKIIVQVFVSVLPPFTKRK